MTKAAAPPPPNPLIEIVLTIILPSLVLDQLSKPERLGPLWALVVSLLFPLGFGVWCFVQKKGWNLFSILGFATILLTGSLGLLKLQAFWFAVKESTVPLIIGLAFPLSHRFGKPLINAMILQPHVMNLEALHGAITTPEKRTDYNQAVFRASCGMALGMVGSSIANFFLAMYLLGGKEPATEAFMKGIAKLNWMGMIVIGVPMMVVMLFVFFRLLKHLQRITGLERDDLMNPGTTVRRQVGG
ncbi:MAG TPA: VC0807 family protein [Candidatus Saccharimonadia bacterium]|nr:VC0807 family protein [Candidatus Saccharimonadia bacterium]